MLHVCIFSFLSDLSDIVSFFQGFNFFYTFKGMTTLSGETTCCFISAALFIGVSSKREDFAPTGEKSFR